ncbi:MAG: hypothetical protein ACR2HS_04310 [Gammaproteobacteria bacterium]
MFTNINPMILGINYNYAKQQQSTEQYIYWPNSLFCAIEANDYEAVSDIILKCIYLINLNNIYNGYSFLSRAILIKNQYIVELLLKYKADPNFIAIPHLDYFPLNQVMDNILDENNSKNHIDYQILQLLFEFKADPNVFTKYEPLAVAVEHKSYKLISLLLEKGANPYSGLVMCLSMSRSTKTSSVERKQWLNIENLFSSKYHVLFKSMINYFSANLNEDKFITRKYKKKAFDKKKDTIALPQSKKCNNFKHENSFELTTLWNNYTANTNEIIDIISIQDEYNPEDILKFIENDEDFSFYVNPYKINSISDSSNKYYNKI